MLALVLVQPLHLDVEERVRIYEYVGSLLDEARQNSLIIGLNGLPLLLEVGVRDQPLQLRELMLQIRYPPVADMTGDQRTQFRIAQRDPAPRRHSVGHVEEFLRRHPVEVAEHRPLQECGMEDGDPIDRMTPHARKVRHADVFISRIINQRKPPKQLIVIRIAHPEIVQEAAIDLVDDFHMARQQPGKQRQRPSLQRFGE